MLPFNLIEVANADVLFAAAAVAGEKVEAEPPVVEAAAITGKSGFEIIRPRLFIMCSYVLSCRIFNMI